MDLKQLLEDLREVQSNLDSGYHEEAENLLNFVIGELAVDLTQQSNHMNETERRHYIRMIEMYKSTAVSGVLSALAFATIAIGTIIYMVIK